MTSSTSNLLTVAEVAVELHVHPDTVRRRIRAGEIRVVRMGRNIIRVRREDLEEFMRRGANLSLESK